jgi:hypothetical protein
MLSPIIGYMFEKDLPIKEVLRKFNNSSLFCWICPIFQTSFDITVIFRFYSK